jgi:hypothetical protein
VKAYLEPNIAHSMLNQIEADLSGLLGFLYQQPVLVKGRPCDVSQKLGAGILMDDFEDIIFLSPWGSEYQPTNCEYFSLLARITTYLGKCAGGFSGKRIQKPRALSAGEASSAFVFEVCSQSGDLLGFWRWVGRITKFALAIDRHNRRPNISRTVAVSIEAQINSVSINQVMVLSTLRLCHRNWAADVSVHSDFMGIINMETKEVEVTEDSVPLVISLGQIELSEADFLQLRIGSRIACDIPGQFPVTIRLGQQEWCTGIAALFPGRVEITVGDWSEKSEKKSISDATISKNLRIERKPFDLQGLASAE